MNRLRLITIASLLMLPALTVAQQAVDSSPKSTAATAQAQSSVPTPESQLKFLSAQLGLSADQQTKMKPVLHDMREATLKILQDGSLSHDDRMEEMKASHEEADRKIRVFLTDEQKKKLDEVEHEPHPELHGKLSEGTGH
jgi:hypothetical protein